MVYLVVQFELQDGKRDDFLGEFLQVVPQVRREEGCIQYVPTVDQIDTGISLPLSANSNRVTLIEQWESLDALKAHLAAAHMIQYREKVKHLIAKVTVQLLQPR